MIAQVLYLTASVSSHLNSRLPFPTLSIKPWVPKIAFLPQFSRDRGAVMSESDMHTWMDYGADKRIVPSGSSTGPQVTLMMYRSPEKETKPILHPLQVAPEGWEFGWYPPNARFDWAYPISRTVFVNDSYVVFEGGMEEYGHNFVAVVHRNSRAITGNWITYLGERNWLASVPSWKDLLAKKGTIYTQYYNSAYSLNLATGREKLIKSFGEHNFIVALDSKALHCIVLENVPDSQGAILSHSVFEINLKSGRRIELEPGSKRGSYEYMYMHDVPFRVKTDSSSGKTLGFAYQWASADRKTWHSFGDWRIVGWPGSRDWWIIENSKHERLKVWPDYKKMSDKSGPGPS